MSKDRIRDALELFMKNSICTLAREDGMLDGNDEMPGYIEALETLEAARINTLIVHEKACSIYGNASDLMTYHRLNTFPYADAASELVRKYMEKEIKTASDEMVDILETRRKPVGGFI